MDEAVRLDQMKQYERIFSTMLTQEVSADSVVPDFMPDIERILAVSPKVFVRSREISDGAVSLDGTVCATILYTAEGENLPQRMEISVPFSMSCEDPQLEVTDKLWAVVSVNGYETKALNSRKISFRAEGAASIAVYRENTISVSSDFTNDDIEVLRESAEIGFSSSAVERCFTVSEELSLSDDRYTLEDVLLYRVSLQSEEVRKIGSKMILQGYAALTILYTAAENEDVHTDSFRVPFSQILDGPEEEICTAVLCMNLLSCSIEPVRELNGSKNMELELQINAQVMTTARSRVEYASDAYCNHHTYEIASENIRVYDPFALKELRVPVKESVWIPVPAAEVLYTDMVCSVPFPVGESLRMTVILSCVYKSEEGKLESVTRKAQAEFPAGGLDTENCSFGSAKLSEPVSAASGDHIDISVDLSLETAAAAKKTISALKEVTVFKEEEFDMEDCPSVMVVRPCGRSVWELAKEYHSTCALIENANPCVKGDDTMILIPRAR